MSGIVTTGGSNGPLAAGGLFAPTPVKTSAYTANAGDFVPVDTTSANVTVTLPIAPPDQTNVTVQMVNQASAHTVTVATGGADVLNVPAGPTSLTLTMLSQSAMLQYRQSTGVWYVVHAPSLAQLLAGFTATGYTAPAVVALTDGATISVNAALGNDFRVTIAGNRTLANPTNLVDGQKLTFQVTQDATGSRTLTYGAAYDFGTAGAPTLTVTAAKTDLLRFVYNATAAKLFYEGSNLGM